MNRTHTEESALRETLPDQAGEINAACWVMEQLDVEGGRHADVTRIRRFLREAVGTWPGDPEERWWRWVVEAGESYGLRSRPLDGTLEQLCEITHECGQVIVRVGATGAWYGVTGTKSGKIVLLDPGSDRRRMSVRESRLQQLLGLSEPGDTSRFVVLEPHYSGMNTPHQHSGHMHPFARAIALLRPESGDIWIVVIFAIISGILALATPLAMESLVSTVTFGRLLQPVVVLSVLLFGFLAFQAAIRGLQTYVAEIIQRRVFARVAADLAYRLPRTTAESFEDHSGRELVNRFFDVVTVQKVVSQLLLDGVTLSVNTVVGMAILGFYHPWLLGFDMVLLTMVALVIFVMGRGAIETSIEESILKYRIASWLEDLAGCPLAFRHYGGGHFALEKADRLIFEYLNARRMHFRILLRQILFALGLQAVASTMLLGLGGWLVIKAQLTLGQLVAAELIVTVIVGSFAKLGKHMESFYDMMASVDKLGHLFDLPVEKQEGLLALQVDSPASCEVREVVYHYNDGRSVFEGLNLSIQAGERVAIAGPSGSGKSVLLDLIYGLRSPQRGHLEIDGIDPRELRPDILRRSVVLVRDIEVFEGTLNENIHMERPDTSSSHVRQALKQVGLLENLLELPHGLETEINSTGHPLSANQLRKLMLARAIVGRPTILLIDGILDALPDEEASEILNRLCEVSQPWTLLLVTGRASLARCCHRTIRLDRLDGHSAPLIDRNSEGTHV